MNLPNKHITPTIHNTFYAAGCEPMLLEAGADYYHPGIRVCFRFSPELDDAPYYSHLDPTEIVIVVANEDMLVQSFGMNLPNEVIPLDDLGNFIAYRAFSAKCFDHRIASQCHAAASDTVEDAEYTHEEAVEAFELAKQAMAEADKALADANRAYQTSEADFIKVKAPRYIEVLSAS